MYISTIAKSLLKVEPLGKLAANSSPSTTLLLLKLVKVSEKQDKHLQYITTIYHNNISPQYITTIYHNNISQQLYHTFAWNQLGFSLLSQFEMYSPARNMVTVCNFPYFLISIFLNFNTISTWKQEIDLFSKKMVRKA